MVAFSFAESRVILFGTRVGDHGLLDRRLLDFLLFFFFAMLSSFLETPEPLIEKVPHSLVLLLDLHEASRASTDALDHADDVP